MKGYFLKHEKPTRIFHWINLIVFLLLLMTGLAIFNKNVQFLALPFGGLQNAAVLHQYLGFVYFIVPLFYITFYFRLFKKFIAMIADITEDDKQWQKIVGGYLAPLVTGKVPPQDKYNAGQKILGWMIMVFSSVLVATGLVMIFYGNFPPALVRLCYLAHAFSGIFLGCGVIVHFYLAALHPKSSKELWTMLGNGYIEEDFAKHHNYKWYQKMMNRDKSI